MALGDILTELWPTITQQQGLKIVQAFITNHGPAPEGVTNADYVKVWLRRYIRAEVKGADRATAEATLVPLNQATDQDFPE